MMPCAMTREPLVQCYTTGSHLEAVQQDFFNMPFSGAQRSRLTLEKSLLENYFPEDRLRWYNPTASNGEAEVEVDVFTQ